MSMNSRFSKQSVSSGDSTHSFNPTSSLGSLGDSMLDEQASMSPPPLTINPDIWKKSDEPHGVHNPQTNSADIWKKPDEPRGVRIPQTNSLKPSLPEIRIEDDINRKVQHDGIFANVPTIMKELGSSQIKTLHVKDLSNGLPDPSIEFYRQPRVPRPGVNTFTALDPAQRPHSRGFDAKNDQTFLKLSRFQRLFSDGSEPTQTQDRHYNQIHTAASTRGTLQEAEHIYTVLGQGGASHGINSRRISSAPTPRGFRNDEGAANVLGGSLTNTFGNINLEDSKLSSRAATSSYSPIYGSVPIQEAQLLTNDAAHISQAVTSAGVWDPRGRIEQQRVLNLAMAQDQPIGRKFLGETHAELPAQNYALSRVSSRDLLGSVPTQNWGGFPNLSADGMELAGGEAGSTRYRGNPFLPGNQSANISMEESCSLWITNLPQQCDVQRLLSKIRGCGKIYATVINPPEVNKGVSTSAAKLVFFEPQGAQHLMQQASLGIFSVSECVPRVTYNRIRTRAQNPGPESRVLHIEGPKVIVNEEFLHHWFGQRFTYQTEQASILNEDASPTGRRRMEWRFGSYRCQASAAMSFIDKERRRTFDTADNSSMLLWRQVHTYYGVDPCA
ncbi:hypothetical protein BX600DRAFT_513256 [Xylariales sp. PMI_506]|nr:hypothetical protein BX600DRAFT_513256 [Xylariales sp. PMI_506]